MANIILVTDDGKEFSYSVSDVFIQSSKVLTNMLADTVHCDSTVINIPFDSKVLSLLGTETSYEYSKVAYELASYLDNGIMKEKLIKEYMDKNVSFDREGIKNKVIEIVLKEAKLLIEKGKEYDYELTFDESVGSRLTLGNFYEYMRSKPELMNGTYIRRLLKLNGTENLPTVKSDFKQLTDWSHSFNEQIGIVYKRYKEYHESIIDMDIVSFFGSIVYIKSKINGNESGYEGYKFTRKKLIKERGYFNIIYTPKSAQVEGHLNENKRKHGDYKEWELKKGKTLTQSDTLNRRDHLEKVLVKHFHYTDGRIDNVYYLKDGYEKRGYTRTYSKNNLFYDSDNGRYSEEDDEEPSDDDRQNEESSDDSD